MEKGYARLDTAMLQHSVFQRDYGEDPWQQEAMYSLKVEYLTQYFTLGSQTKREKCTKTGLDVLDPNQQLNS